MVDRKIKNKTLQQLEGDYWKEPKVYPTKLVEDVFALRKKPLRDFDSNDIRILLTQNVGLKYLVPEAINILELNIFEESLYFPGDLLLALVSVEEEFWRNDNEIRKKLSNLLKQHLTDIKDSDLLDEEAKGAILSRMQFFQK